MYWYNEAQGKFNRTQYALYQNYPDPSNLSTVLEFDLPEPAAVTFKVQDVLGREVTGLLGGEYRGPDRYGVKFDASQLGSGVYFQRITAGSFTSVRKMFLVH